MTFAKAKMEIGFSRSQSSINFPYFSNSDSPVIYESMYSSFESGIEGFLSGITVGLSKGDIVTPLSKCYK